MSGMRVLPTTPARELPAAAVVAHHDRMVPIDPMYRALDAHPADKPIREVRLVPITVADFYAKEVR